MTVLVGEEEEGKECTRYDVVCAFVCHVTGKGEKMMDGEARQAGGRSLRICRQDTEGEREDGM